MISSIFSGIVLLIATWIVKRFISKKKARKLEQITEEQLDKAQEAAKEKLQQISTITEEKTHKAKTIFKKLITKTTASKNKA